MENVAPTPPASSTAEMSPPATPPPTGACYHDSVDTGYGQLARCGHHHTWVARLKFRQGWEAIQSQMWTLCSTWGPPWAEQNLCSTSADTRFQVHFLYEDAKNIFTPGKCISCMKMRTRFWRGASKCISCMKLFGHPLPSAFPV